ncbi:MAG: ABC transporter permease [Chloroflexi bacterium]|nr:ABC transporter permease [Chloroflexota bacterium]
MAAQIKSPPGFLRRLSTFFYSRPVLTLLALLAVPLLWLLIFYIGALLALLINSFFYFDDAGLAVRIVREFSLYTYQQLFTPANLDIIGRTVLMAASVTVFSALMAFPFAYYMARYATGRVKGLLYLAVTVPLWSSYLVRVYSWKLILANEGVVTWFFNAFGLGGVLQAVLDIPVIGGRTLSVSYLGMFLVFVYIWLPYMILPINAALERVPKSLIEASSDLGGHPGYTFRRIILPLAFPGVVAGSIFTFSLTLGDYIIPGVIGDSSFFIGSAVLSYQGTSGNIPLAAAMTVVPIAIMLIYLTIARRLGAFDAL